MRPVRFHKRYPTQNLDKFYLVPRCCDLQPDNYKQYRYDPGVNWRLLWPSQSLIVWQRVLRHQRTDFDPLWLPIISRLHKWRDLHAPVGQLRNYNEPSSFRSLLHSRPKHYCQLGWLASLGRHRLRTWMVLLPTQHYRDITDHKSCHQHPQHQRKHLWLAQSLQLHAPDERLLPK